MSYYMETTGQEEVLKTVVRVAEKFQTSVRCQFAFGQRGAAEQLGGDWMAVKEKWRSRLI